MDYSKSMIAKLRYMLYCRGYVVDPLIDELDSLVFGGSEKHAAVIHRETSRNIIYATIVFVLNNPGDVVKQDREYFESENTRIGKEREAQGVVCDKAIVIYNNSIHYTSRDILSYMKQYNMLNIQDLEIGLYDHMFCPRELRKLNNQEVKQLSREIRMTVDHIKSGGIPILYATRHISSYLDLSEGDIVLTMEPSIAKYDEQITLVDGSTAIINSIIDFPKYYVVKRIRPEEEEHHKTYVKEAYSDRESKKSMRQLAVEYEGEDEDEVEDNE